MYKGTDVLKCSTMTGYKNNVFFLYFDIYLTQNMCFIHKIDAQSPKRVETGRSCNIVIVSLQ